MIKVTDKTNIYVHCPAEIVTGGAELLHQLVSTLNNNGKKAYIVYFGKTEPTVPLDYRNYNIKIAQNVVDEPYNIEVIYEGRFELIRKNKYTQKVLWWLSVDNFFYCSSPFLAINELYKFNKTLAFYAFIRRIGKAILKGDSEYLKHPISIKELRSIQCVNCYQSEYAQNFLQNNKFKEILPLKDFINREHDFKKVDLSLKENIVLYNPKKGYKFTKKIIESAPEINWVPLVGMTRNELINIIKRAKVYIDFGNHPGKDRLPRECAINGCCVITGYRGSARFFEDVMITRDYKFEDSTKKIPAIIEKIKWIFSNYNIAIHDFELYRNSITEEETEFQVQTSKLFGYKI